MSTSMATVLLTELSLFFKTFNLPVRLVSCTDGGKYYFKVGKYLFFGKFSNLHKGEFILQVSHNDKRVEGFSFEYTPKYPSGCNLMPLVYFVTFEDITQFVYLSDHAFRDPYMEYQPKKGEIILRSIDTYNIYPMICYDKAVRLRFKSKIPAIQFWIEKQIG